MNNLNYNVNLFLIIDNFKKKIIFKKEIWITKID